MTEWVRILLAAVDGLPYFFISAVLSECNSGRDAHFPAQHIDHKYSIRNLQLLL